MQTDWARPTSSPRVPWEHHRGGTQPILNQSPGVKERGDAVQGVKMFAIYARA